MTILLCIEERWGLVSQLDFKPRCRQVKLSMVGSIPALSAIDLERKEQGQGLLPLMRENLPLEAFIAHRSSLNMTNQFQNSEKHPIPSFHEILSSFTDHSAPFKRLCKRVFHQVLEEEKKNSLSRDQLKEKIFQRIKKKFPIAKACQYFP